MSTLLILPLLVVVTFPLVTLRLPATPGMEGSRTVEAVRDSVTEFSVGDRVAYAGLPPGAYAETRVIPWHRLVRLPADFPKLQAGGMMLRGMTARYVLYGCFKVKREDAILIHAAAGGVGLIVSQWAKHLGATVIGTVGSMDKAELARAHGCDHTILYRQEDFPARVRNLTEARGVDVVYDSVGQATFMRSLDCLRPMGMSLSFGQSSGTVPPFDLSLLSAKGSLFVTRPSLMAYTEKRDDLLAHARHVFEVVTKGVVRIEIDQTYPLAETSCVHRDVEARKTTGSTILIPC